MKRLLLAVAGFVVALPLAAMEGKWTPQQVLELDAAMLKKEGLALAPSQLWNPKTGTGLLAATVQVGGCSGGFISNEGLFVTNHHCLFSILQEHATPQNDIITNGFLARSRGEELRGGSLRLTVPRRFTDVTKEVLGAVPANATDAERTKAIERKSSELVAACEKQPSTRCKVAPFDGGVQYILVDALEVSDVRLVYAPARAVGEYGGEVDNWMWPRHTGDFAIGRAYVNGAPMKTEHFFPISTKGVQPGDFVMVVGYPGVTYRSLTADEMTERRDLFFARRRDLYGEWIHALEETTKGNAAGTIAVADTLKSLDNRYKNAQGQLAGFTSWGIVEQQRKRDEAVLAWAAKNGKYASAVEAYRGLASLIAEQRRTWERDFLLSQIGATAAAASPAGPRALYFATAVVRNAIEKTKPDAERDPLYMQRNLARNAERLTREQKSYFEPADRAMLELWLRRAQSLSANQRIAAVANINLDQLYRSPLFDPNERAKMLNETPDQLRARHDALLDLGFALDSELRDLAARRERWEGIVSRLRPEWRRAVIAHAGKPVAPDANSTLRVSFAHVKGYEPRDGVWYVPQTTLAGAIEKHTGAEPFDAPRNVREAAAAKNYGRWKDMKLGDVPVDFLADADTTGGNSGSPTVNGRGEIVGVNFDRVWENVANDFGYNPKVGRNVNVDIRYLMWMLDRIEHADALLKELGVQ